MTLRGGARIGGWGFIWVGVFILGFVGYQLFITDLMANGQQAILEEELNVQLAQASAEDVAPTLIDISNGNLYQPETGSGGSEVDPETGLVSGKLGVPVAVEVTYEDTPESGTAIGVLRIPDIGLEWVVVEGVTREVLKSGAGHMPSTPMPGQLSNAVISGHRTTYGRPFFNMEQVKVGSTIEWESPVTGISTYEVREIIIVEPNAVWVTDVRPGAWLTLTTCNPKFSARERLIVFAELVDGVNYNAAQAVLNASGDLPGTFGPQR